MTLRHYDLRLVGYDDKLIEEAAWLLAKEDGYKSGRGPVEQYKQRIADVILALEVAAETREQDGRT